MKSEFKKIVVLGAGAVGCYFGGLLARAGSNVHLIARDNHVKAIKKNGLFLECLSFQERIAVNSSTDTQAVEDADLILVCVKSPHTKSALQEIKNLIKPGTLILSLQNGVDNAERISEVVSNKVVPAVVYVATSMVANGHVKHFGRGELIVGNMNTGKATPSDLKELCDLFLNAGAPCVISENIQRELWLKFLVNCSYNGISAIGQISYGDMVKQERIKIFINRLTSEFLWVAQQEKIDISFDEAMIVNEQIAITMSGQKSSTAQDLALGKPTEIDYLNGLIIQKAEQYGIDVPNHRAIYALVKMLEDKNKCIQS